MKSKTATLILNMPKERVFSYVSNVNNLPRWATEFCKELRTIDGKTRVVTDHGELFLQIAADENTGVVDFLAGPTEDKMGVFPSRVVALPDETSAYSFTLFQAADMSDEEFEKGFRSLQKELENLKNDLA